MNTQFHNDLASNKKIDKVFHAFGHSIPVAKDGRRLWPSSSNVTWQISWKQGNSR